MQQPAHSGTSPLKYHPAYEVLDENRVKRDENLQETLRKISETTYRQSTFTTRSVHGKSHGLIYAEMDIYADLPENLAQGIFKQARKLPLVMRFSTVPGDILKDKACTPRSLAIKIIGVEGERLSGSEEATTQDFLFVNGSSFLSCSVQQFLSNLKSLSSTADSTSEFRQFLSRILQATSKLIESLSGYQAIIKTPDHPAQGSTETHLLGETYFSQDPALYGDFMAKFALVPVAPALIALTNKPIDLTFAADSLRKSVVDFFISHTAEWELRVQLCTDIDQMPIEDASVIWSPDLSPYIPVARITAKPQIAWSPYRSHIVDEGMMFSPWHGIQSHRPLGSVMRLRKMTYELSRKQRSAPEEPKACEPTNLDDLCE
ncbi:hypothetical protein SAMN05192566_2260 [Methylophilus rhizosphaerae]|uniref:Catalase n=1 Tax=Methylophilus rhizosphaerae TaxID=492660 RepID=A0A1G9EAP6_9PROT|nr:catalase family protein [Methylophilus rhizosphaerae]SDK73095.1 hypothetical protein SAMN05192566_2260 [Methylophilus rhizosphaerae]